MSPTRNPRRAVLLVALVVLSLAAVPAASAQTTRSGGTVTVPVGTTETGNLTAIGGTVIVEGTLDGDLEGIAGSILITGTVTGDVQATAGSVTIGGTVEGDVETAAGDVTVTEDGRIGGSLSAGAGSVTIAGAVDGTAEIGAEELTVAPTASIGGDLRYDAETADIADGAVAGTVERTAAIDPGTGAPFGGPFEGAALSGPFAAAFGFLANAMLGAVLLLAAPGLSRRVAGTGTERPAASAGAGLAALIGVPIALVAVAITVVGIPLSLAGLLAYLVLLWVGFVCGAVVAGTWLLGRAGSDSRWGALAVGLLLPALASLVGISRVFDLVYLLLGLGALALAALAIRRGERPPLPDADESDPGDAEEPAAEPS